MRALSVVEGDREVRCAACSETTMTIPAPVIAVVLAAAGIAGCASELPPSSFEGGTPSMRPEVFFAGKTSSSGVMENSSGLRHDASKSKALAMSFRTEAFAWIRA